MEGCLYLDICQGENRGILNGVSVNFKLFQSLNQSQSWGLTSRSTARVILGQVLSIATCGTRTHRGDSL